MIHIFHLESVKQNLKLTHHKILITFQKAADLIASLCNTKSE